MRYFFLIATLCFLGSTVTFGQDLDNLPTQGRVAERIKSMKVAFLTNKLGLSSEQSQTFWPIYNDFEAKQQNLRQKYRQNKNINLMDDAEVEQQIDARFQLEQELLDLKKQYYEKLKSAISIRQIANIARAEREFKTVLLKELQKNRQRGNKD